MSFLRKLFPVLTIAALAAACSSNSGTDPDPDPGPQPVRGEDTFGSAASLSRYDQAALEDTGSWRVMDGKLVGTGPAIQSVLVRKDDAFLNGWVETTSSKADDGGLVLRYSSESTYYLLAFRDDDAPGPRGELNVAVYRRAADQFRELARGDIDWPRGTARTIRFEVAGGGVLRVYLDGQLFGEVQDPQPPLAAGRVGVRQYGADSTWVTTFDTFRWEEAAQ